MTIDHPDYQAMLAAVLADPADDMPRLVLADWLEENGEEDYGSFIRIQCEIETLPLDWRTLKRSRGETKESRMARRVELRERESNLALKHLRDWFPLPVRGHVAAITDVRFVGIDRTYFFRRGFVDSVALPLRLWVGEPCPGCIEPGELDDGDPRCRLCHGLGTVGGLGPELVRRCPLTKVTLTDREPSEDEYEDYLIGTRGSNWGWVRREWGDQSDRLPPELFDRMELPLEPSYPEIKQAPTRQAAIDALSAACLGWARAVPTDTTESPREGATR